MTVSPNRPQDGNRRPSSKIRDARRSLRARSSSMPPILFQLPNLSPGSEQETDTQPVADEPPALEELAPPSAEMPSKSESRITRIDPPESDVSVLERVGTHAVVFGMLGLMIAGAIYIGRNVRSPKKPQMVDEQLIDEPTVDIASLNPTSDPASAFHIETPAFDNNTAFESPSIAQSTQLHRQAMQEPEFHAPAGHSPNEYPIANHIEGPAAHSGDIADPGDIVVSLSEPMMQTETSELPAITTSNLVPSLPASIAISPASEATIPETELQNAERSKQLAEQISRTEAAIQDSLPDGPAKPLEQLADIASKAKATIKEPIAQIPSDDKLDEELNAALESMKSETLSAADFPAMDAVVKQPDVVEKTLELSADESNFSSNAASTPANVVSHPTTSTPIEPNTAIAEILKPGSSTLEGFTNAQANSDATGFSNATDFSDASSIAAQPARSAEMITPPSTQLKNYHSRTPHAVANWLKYLPPAPAKR